MRQYRPRGMPRRFLEGAPDVVRRQVLDIIRLPISAPLDYDILFRPDPDAAEVVGLDFGAARRGCHFFLAPHEARAYRERSRRKRVAWADLPEPTRRAILAYCEEE